VPEKPTRADTGLFKPDTMAKQEKRL
jgi:hypothetical protein